MNYHNENPVTRSMKLHPRLQALLERVFLKAPAMSFEAFNFVDTTIVKVVVWYDMCEIGDVSIVRRNHPSKGRIEEYHIKSENIKKQRSSSKGDKNVKVTCDLNVAVKTALAVFKPKPAQVLAEKYLVATEDYVGSARRRTSSTFRIRVNDDAMLASCVAILHHLRSGDPLSVSDETRSRLFQVASDIDTARIWVNLQAALDANDGMVIVKERTGSLSATDWRSKTLTIMDDASSLPVNFQEKFALLHIADEGAAIENVGVRWVLNDRQMIYFLTGGATVMY